MPRACTVCSHRDVSAITQGLVSGTPYRQLERQFGVTPAAISAHVKQHLAGPLRRIVQSERNLATDAMSVTPVLVEMRRLNLRTQRILAICEASKDWSTSIDAIRQLQSGLEFIAKLTGELSPAAIADRGPVTINVVRVPMPAPRPVNRVLDAPALPEPDPAA